MNSVEIFTWADENIGNVRSIMYPIDTVIHYADIYWYNKHREHIHGIVIQDAVASYESDNIGVRHDNAVVFSQGCISRRAMRVPFSDVECSVFLDYRLLSSTYSLVYNTEFVCFVEETPGGTMYRCNVRILYSKDVEYMNGNYDARRLRP